MMNTYPVWPLLQQLGGQHELMMNCSCSSKNQKNQPASMSCSISSLSWESWSIRSPDTRKIASSNLAESILFYNLFALRLPLSDFPGYRKPCSIRRARAQSPPQAHCARSAAGPPGRLGCCPPSHLHAARRSLPATHARAP